MKRYLLVWSLFAFLIPMKVHAHCQIPCGIYDDHARIHSMYEATETIRKAVTDILSLIRPDKTAPLPGKDTRKRRPEEQQRIRELAELPEDQLLRLIDTLERRIANDPSAEFAEACAQAERIAEVHLAEKMTT